MLCFIVFISLIVTALCRIIPLQLFDARIVGGQDATIETFPHQVSLRCSGQHCCGGSIYKSNVIISAAHCTDNQNVRSLTVVAGSTYKTTGGVSIPVKKIIQHERYDKFTSNYDIAIVFLQNGFKFGDSIQPISLATANELVRSGTRALVSGWGALQEYGSYPDTLQYVAVSIISNADCAKSYGSSRITPVMICAGETNGGKDACQMDSGGPLIVGNKLVGIVSWGIGCGRSQYPGVYASIPALRSWIDGKLQ